MTESGVPAGWYDDPQVPGLLRYYDGVRWTEHTSPAPVALPAPAYAGGGPPPVGNVAPAAPGFSYDITPGGWSQTTVHPTQNAGGWTSGRKIVVGAAAVLVGLSLLGAVLGVAHNWRPRLLASGPPLALTTTTPVTVVGRTAATGAASEQARAQMNPLVNTAFTGLPGASTPHLEIYGPGGPSAPERGNGYVVLIWTSVTKPFDQDAFVAGEIRGLTRAAPGATTQTFPEANGGETVCAQSRPANAGVSMVECAWIRSGTGVVVSIEYDVPVTVALADNRELVTQLARPV